MNGGPPAQGAPPVTGPPPGQETPAESQTPMNQPPQQQMPMQGMPMQQMQPMGGGMPPGPSGGPPPPHSPHPPIPPMGVPREEETPQQESKPQIATENIEEEDDDPKDCFLVYASNIPGYLTKEQFSEMVQPYAREGPIKKVKLFKRLATDSSYGFVYFHSHNDGMRCIQELHRRVYDGHTMRWSHGDGARGPLLSNTNLYVEGVPAEWGDVELRTHFQEYGDITAARILVDKSTSMSREVGFVHFATHEQALAAMQAANGQKAYEGAPRTFKIKFANRGRKQEKPPPPPPGPRYEEPCRYYARGHCKRGNACFYRHVAPGMNDYPPPPGPDDYYAPRYPPHPRYPQPGPYPDYYSAQNNYGPPPYAPPNYPPPYSNGGGGYHNGGGGYGPAPRDGGAQRWQPYDVAPRGQPNNARYDYSQPPASSNYGGYDYGAGVPTSGQPPSTGAVPRNGDWGAGYAQQPAAAPVGPAGQTQ